MEAKHSAIGADLASHLGRSKMTAQIRPFEEADLERVQEIAVAAWAPVFGSFRQLIGDRIFSAAFPEWEAEQRRLVGEACLGENAIPAWVALVGGEVEGFVTVRFDSKKKSGEISFNAVHPRSQNQGVGTQMYRFAIGWLREQGANFVQVSTGADPSHAPARKAYEKAGFMRAIPSIHYYLDLTTGSGEEPSHTADRA